MENFIFTAVILALLFEASQAVFCDLTNGGYSLCFNGCCGVLIITCCGSTVKTSSFWSLGVKIGVGVGSVIGFLVLICIIVCCVQACNSGTRRTVVQQNQTQPNIVMMSAAQQNQTQMGHVQQPYPGQPQPYPGPSPYPGPVPYPAQWGYTNPAYPPPYAGSQPANGCNASTDQAQYKNPSAVDPSPNP